MILNKKGQGALEYLLIIGGVIIIAIIVIFIIISTSGSSRDTVDSSQEKMNNITDSAIFPPRIKSSACSFLTDGNISFKLNVFESPSKDVSEYCLYVNNKDANVCSVINLGNLDFNYQYSAADNNSFAINLVAKSFNGLISNKSITSNCYIR
jgi:hypothetical protein